MDEIEPMLVSVRADTSAFAGDVAQMRASLESGLGAGADKAGGAVASALAKAATSGKLSFVDLEKTATAVLADIAAAAVKGGLASLFGGAGGGSDSGLLATLGSLVGGAPGRATGGPVSPGRAYTVGERGPELFVPTTSGSILPATSGAARPVQVAISIQAPAGEAPAALQRSGRQVARAVKAALAAG